MRARYRCVERLDGASVLRDPAPPYGHRFGNEMATLTLSSNSSCNSNDSRIDSIRCNGQTRQLDVRPNALRLSHADVFLRVGWRRLFGPTFRRSRNHRMPISASQSTATLCAPQPEPEGRQLAQHHRPAVNRRSAIACESVPDISEHPDLLEPRCL